MGTDVTDWGWETFQTAGYIPKWTTSPTAEIACIELISCKCAKSCKGNCNCFKADLECTPLCMLNDTGKDRQCSRHRDIEYGCHLYGITYHMSVHMLVVIICSRIE